MKQQKEKKDIAVFICENEELREKILDDFGEDKITYAGIFKVENRKEIVKLLDELTP